MRSYVLIFAVAVSLVVTGPAPVAFAQDSLSPEASADLTMTPVVSALGAVTDMHFLPDGRLLVIEKQGRLVVADVQTGAVTVAGSLPVDTGSEKGLLGVEVDPNFTTNGFIYLYYSCSTATMAEPCDGLNKHRVSRFVLDVAIDQLDTSSELILVRGLRGPANHDGGGIAIGPDGKLYIGVGDTGCNSGQPPGQGITNWFGTCLSNGSAKILRVNLDGTIPADNPLVNETAVTECGATCGVEPTAARTAAPRKDIWAWGFRNPWRLWFDPQNGNLWVGDVGEVTYEELNIVKKGKHYGWPMREGAAGQAINTCGTKTPQSGDCVDPVYYCKHGGAAGGIDGLCTSINSGVIVDTCSWPAPWQGRYFFGDNANRRLFFLNLNATRDGVSSTPPARGALAQFANKLPITFQVGPDGDLYVGALGESGSNGTVFRISPLARDTCAMVDAGMAQDAGADDGGGGNDGGGQGADGGPGGGGGFPPGGGGGEPPPKDVPSCNCAAGTGPGAFVLLGGLALFGALRSRRKS